jgi:hypothetical protein
MCGEPCRNRRKKIPPEKSDSISMMHRVFIPQEKLRLRASIRLALSLL